MKLESISIKNFRSISEATIDIQSNYCILVGINETGKTNILHALRTLDGDYEITREDVRKPLKNEALVKEAYVKFIFKLDNEDINKIVENINSKVLLNNYNQPILYSKKRSYNFEELIKVNSKGIQHVDIIEAERRGRSYQFSDKYVIHKFNHLVKKLVEPKTTYIFKLKTGEEINISKYKYIDPTLFEGSLDSTFSPVDEKDITKFISAEIREYVEENIPEVIYWEYDKKYLLPPEIDITKFTADYNTCVPLKHMFSLAGIEDIKDEIDNVKKHFIDLNNLLERVADNATKHIKNIWKELKDIKIEMLANGESIVIQVKEHNAFSFSSRSDGYKRLVTFLLMISARDRINDLNNALIIIDEPEIGLHIASQKYLLNELMKIAKNNAVIFSTHSPFMIDKDNIDAHLIITKDNEITKINKVDEDSDYIEEEVINRALGYSMFEGLKSKNIIFEGWTDYKLFTTADKYFNAKIKKWRNNTGFCYGRGVKTLPWLSVIYQSANKDCFIVSDGDDIALEKRKLYLKDHPSAKWSIYTDIYSNTSIITSEDFVKKEAFKSYLNKISSERSIEELNIDLLENPAGKIKVIKDWLKINKIKDVDDCIKVIKHDVFQNLTKSQIKDEYYEFIECLKKYVA